jgi:hypothetical protein
VGRFVEGDAGTPADEPVRPRGRSIGSCLLVPAGRQFDPVRAAVAAIDSVHGDGTLPQLVVRTNASTVEAASYGWDDRSGRPLSLSVSRRAPRPQLAVVHEVGHFLDHQVFGDRRRFGSESDRVPDLMQAIGDTMAVRRLRELRSRRQVLIRTHPHRRERFTLDQALISYLLEPREIFARAYAQYVAVRSGDLRLLTQLQEVQRDLFVGMVYHQQWDQEDFLPVRGAFDRMLRWRRWIE